MQGAKTGVVASNAASSCCTGTKRLHFELIGCDPSSFSDQTGLHSNPLIRQDSNLHSRRMPALRTLPLGGSSLIFVRATLVAPKFAADRARRALHLRTDLAGRETAVVKVLNLVAFVLAQVRVAHVQFHLAVKLCRLPRLRRSIASGGALQN